MAVALSRRGLFRSMTGAVARADEAAAEPQAVVAQIGAGCVEFSGVTCRRCGEACEVDAIRFRPAGGGRVHVLLDQQACTGCGDCVAPCPTGAIALVARDRAALVAGLAELGQQP